MLHYRSEPQLLFYRYVHLSFVFVVFWFVLLVCLISLMIFFVEALLDVVRLGVVHLFAARFKFWLCQV